MNKKPTYNDISPSNGESLDEQWAAEIFLDKNIEEAKKLFATYEKMEHLYWMGPVAFTYYFQAIYEIFENKQDKEYGLNEILSITYAISIRLEMQDDLSVTTLLQMKQVAEWSLERFAQYDIKYDTQSDILKTKKMLVEVIDHLTIILLNKWDLHT